MTNAQQTGKQGSTRDTRSTRNLWEQSRQAFDMGDYVLEQRLCEQVVAAAPESDLASKAKSAMTHTRPDRVAWSVLGLAVLIYALVWTFVL